MCLIVVGTNVPAGLTQDLPTEVQANLLLTEAQRNLDRNNWPAAVGAMRKLKALNVALPDEFHFHNARGLNGTKDYAASLSEVLLYLKKSGGIGKHEEDALKLFLEVKNQKLKAHALVFPERLSAARQCELLRASLQGEPIDMRPGGRISVESLAIRVGASRRSLELAFQRTVGASPKMYCRITCFRHLYDAVSKKESSVDWFKSHWTRAFLINHT